MKITNEESHDEKAPPDFQDWEWGDWDGLNRIVSARAAAILWQQMLDDMEDAQPHYPRFTLTTTEGKPAIIIWLLESHSLVIGLDEICMPDDEDLEVFRAKDRSAFIAIFKGWINRLEANR